MNLYIEIENGQPKNHPVLEENVLQFFGSIPAHWEKFVRVQRPVLKVYEVLDPSEPVYQKIDGAWRDVWIVRNMTEQEKAALQQTCKDIWFASSDRENFASWVFDETQCCYVAPVQCPQDGKDYFWQGTTSSWVEMPPYPEDGKLYVLDIATAAWVVPTTTRKVSDA